MRNEYIAIVMVLVVLVVGYVYNSYYTTQTTQRTAQTAPTAPQPFALKIAFVKLPDNVNLGGKFEVSWIIDANQKKRTDHTAVHYGYESRPGDLSIDVTPGNSGYPDLVAISGLSEVPNVFSVALVAQDKGTIYLRAHGIFDGKNYWTEEKAIAVK